MLFTRCPECETTFRVTDEASKKASGQVRCGRCATVFNAYAELQDSAKVGDPKLLSPVTEIPSEPLKPGQGAPAPASTTEARAANGDAAQGDDTDEAVADPAVPQETAAAPSAAPNDDADEGPDLISAKEIDQVLTANVGAGLPPATPTWSTLGAHPVRGRPSRWWGAAAALALLALLAQGLHHYRSEIAGHPTFGPWIQQAYGLVGTELTPSWDVHQYEILDWVATAEPNSRGLGSLKITARIQNRGPLRQPYPAVQLRLKDRWEAAVSSRVFTPAEYLPSDSPRGRLMSPGETARAEIEVVDPGPDAYGFELDVCIEVEASLVTCGTDEVFL
ncbi:MAG TPA: DUF3426 domain-containing protein [Gammaproteobacteria bacterium]